MFSSISRIVANEQHGEVINHHHGEIQGEGDLVRVFVMLLPRLVNPGFRNVRKAAASFVWGCSCVAIIIVHRLPRVTAKYSHGSKPVLKRYWVRAASVVKYCRGCRPDMRGNIFGRVISF